MPKKDKPRPEEAANEEAGEYEFWLRVSPTGVAWSIPTINGENLDRTQTAALLRALAELLDDETIPLITSQE